MIPVLVEGDTEVPIVDKLLALVGTEVGTVYGLKGKDRLDQLLPKYNQAARFGRWFVLRDLNGDGVCAPDLVQRLLPHPATHMCFRVAVRASEAWLLADRERICEFLAVRTGRVTENPDDLRDPKQRLVNLARDSRRRAIREDMVPARGTSARVGPGYTARIIEFATTRWRPEVAAVRSPSLTKCIAALRRWA
jgi:hypothetical protein